MLTLTKWTLDDYHKMIDEGILGDRHVEFICKSLTLTNSEPEPDVAIVRYPPELYLDHHP